ncbi:hypothetical protein BCR37DRAFT_390489 [Protomyces lactucae-debilis]|uniref:GDS1 winged helix domain-containing protein n=1 Tax=Protomyces lactucae-debilis TaxID=2754530 RepID=A0A1Y2FVK5_PROLT|nr:uncharacterized protein BCR37DRAFT_390489 [Protomyces lactucae-debilis]ORY87989.1 hypothetical protein BCR37DRAFT_390489 [Protomyces lactucae-debilis]
MAVSSSYNTRRHAPKRTSPSIDTPTSDRLGAKRLKLAKRDPYTPPASPDRIDTASAAVFTAQQDAEEDQTFLGIVDYLRRHAHEGARCSRQISEGMLAEGKISLNGTTPSTTIDAAIRSHFKRSTGAGRLPAVAKAADPQFPRKTLYHLADASPLPSAPAKQVAFTQASPAQQSGRRRSVTAHTAGRHSVAVVPGEESDDGSELSEHDSQDGLGPFAGPTRQSSDITMQDSEHSNPERSLSSNSHDLNRLHRHERSPSPDLQFALSIHEVKDTVQTPAASQPSSPMRAHLREEKLAKPTRVNIALPPSPFISPQQSDEEEASEVVSVLAQQDPSLRFSTMRSESVSFSDLSDVQVRSPEEVTLGELDDLLSAFD